MKLTKDQIEQIKKLREEGNTIAELSEMFQVTVSTIKHHTDSAFRIYQRNYQRKWYKNMTPEKKRKYFEKKREYQKAYHKNRYKNDEGFRKKQIERSLIYQKLKGGKKNENI